MNTLTILFIIVAHWYSDFVKQTDFQAINKSSSNVALTSHVFDYATYMSLFILIYQLILVGLSITLMWKLMAFQAITFVAHFVTDYFTSRRNAKLWQAGKRHEFFVNVGLDQVLHYTQLFLTYNLLF